jgi:hypothetical protein
MVLHKAAQQSPGAARPVSQNPTGAEPRQVVVVLLIEK